jgi:hypothetical protein
MAIYVTHGTSNPSGTSSVALPPESAIIHGSGTVVLENPLIAAGTIVARYPINIMWRYVNATFDSAEHFEIGVFGDLVYRNTGRRSSAVLPIRKLPSLEDVVMLWNGLVSGAIKLEEAPTYKIGEALQGERIETVADIHARLPRRRRHR